LLSLYCLCATHKLKPARTMPGMPSARAIMEPESRPFPVPPVGDEGFSVGEAVSVGEAPVGAVVGGAVVLAVVGEAVVGAVGEAVVAVVGKAVAWVVMAEVVTFPEV